MTINEIQRLLLLTCIHKRMRDNSDTLKCIHASKYHSTLAFC